MKRSMGLWQLWGFATVSLFGTVLHFLYDWLGGAAWIAPFSGVNESTWEHMKLFFWPAFIFALVQSFFFKERRDFLCIKLRGIIVGLLMIPVLFYTYNGAVGKSPDWLNITIFFISAAAAFIYEWRQLKKEISPCLSPRLAFGILCAIGLSFIIFTFNPPSLGIFRDPLTGEYGI